MALVYGDVHIHIGRTSTGKPVKITASPKLTLENIPGAAQEKGLGLIGLVDAACRGVLQDLEILTASGKMQLIPGGGYLCEGVTLLLGHEVEIAHTTTGREAHFLGFFPDLTNLQSYARELAPSVTNPSLSTQRLRMDGDTWLEMVIAHQGVALAAHAFTPHKGVYGNCVRQLGEMFSRPDLISGLELGLSANTDMAAQIQDTHRYTYISNSDAHSLATMGREFTVYDLPSPSFKAWAGALRGPKGGIVATHGLEPLLGKYYRSYCKACQLLARGDHPVSRCQACGGPVVYGVWDRLREVADVSWDLPRKPPYRSHVPLMMLPGIGPKIYGQLIEKLGTEIEVMYTVSLEAIGDLVGADVAEQIAGVRQGNLPIQPGGGGKYGRVKKAQER